MLILATEGGRLSTESFVALYQRYHRLLLTVAEQRLGGTSEPADVTAEVFRVAWMRELEGEEITLSWLYQTLRNVIGNEYRRVARADRRVQAAGHALDDKNTNPNDDDAHLIRAAIKGLSEPDREVIYMTYWEDLSSIEIAAILGCSAAAVRQRLARARKRLEAALSELNPTKDV